MTRRVCLVVVLAILVAWSPVQAATLYVNNSGSPACSDATAKASNSAGSPWCSIMRAAWGSTTYSAKVSGEAAAAGDIVLITAGTYTTNSGNTVASNHRFDVQLNPVNSGSSGNPITFRGSGTVEIRAGTDGGSPILGPMIGCNVTNYITWDGVTINDYYGGSVGGTGPVVFFSSTGCILKNSTIQGHSGSFNNGRALFTDNYSAILIEQSDYTTIYNNTISRVWGIGTSSSDPNTYNHNNACIMLYNSSDTIMEHNDISDAGSGIFIKGIQGSVHLTQQRNIVRYNLIHDISEGVFEYFGEDSRIYNNVLMNIRKIGFHVGGGTNSVDLANNAVRTVFTNNTMYNVGDAGSGMCVGMQGPYVDTWTIKNNLCTDSLRAFGSLWDSTPAGYASQLFFDRNLYYNNTNDGYWSGGGTMTLATWQGTYSEDTNTSTSDPLFVNGSTTYTLATDFKLQGGSPALTLGRAVANICGATGATIPAGAYCTGSEAIGIESTTTPNRFSPLYLRR